MEGKQQGRWTESGRLLTIAFEQYRSDRKYSITRATAELADYLPGRIGGVAEKTVRRHLRGRAMRNDHVEDYAQWLYDEAKMPRAWIAEWLDCTTHPRPGELLARICDV